MSSFPMSQPTKDRQDAMHRLVAESEVIVVVGGPDSNNSRKLTELARNLGRPAYQVAGVKDLRPEWFGRVAVVGVTAGTSTPDDTIDEVRVWLEALPGRRQAKTYGDMLVFWGENQHVPGCPP